MNPTDHKRCSELLQHYAQGRLDAPDHDWVEGHLATCRECRAEHSVVAALARGEVAPLTDIERIRLHRGVRTAISSAAVTSVAPARTPARGGRLLQVLGTAALLVMIGGFIYTSGLMGGGDMAEQQAGQDGAGSAESGDAPAGVEQAEGNLDSARSTDAGAGGGAGSDTALESRALPEPGFRRSLGSVTGKKLRKLGREGLPLVVFSRSYRVEQVPELQSDFRDRLALAASPHEETVRECSDVVTEAFANALPAYGALGTLERLDGEDVLVLAFAWTDQNQGPLDQSMVWAWPLGNCGQPVEYFKNVIRPRS